MVFAGGGYVAGSWEIGIATGLADGGLDIRDTDLFIGTSAGARVALDLTSGRSFEDIYRPRAEGPGPGPAAAQGAIDWPRIREGVEEAKRVGGSPTEILRRYGALARAVAVGSVEERRAVVAAQLPMLSWPERRVLITAVDAQSGERRAFDRESGIDLVDAVLATTAAFGSPLVPFAGCDYFDGGYHSSDHADLAVGQERVLVLALRSPPEAMRLVTIEAGVEALRRTGAEVEVIHPDEETMAALVATGGQMNPASGKPAAIAGRRQGRSISDRIAAFWR